LLYRVPIEAPPLGRVADHERMVGEGIHDPRDPARIGRDPFEGAVREEIEIPGAGDPQAEADVRAELVRAECADRAPDGNPLLELAELGQVQARPELGLAGEENLQKRLARGLEVREE